MTEGRKHAILFAATLHLRAKNHRPRRLANRMGSRQPYLTVNSRLNRASNTA